MAVRIESQNDDEETCNEEKKLQGMGKICMWWNLHQGE
jgi:hypothetical protein